MILYLTEPDAATGMVAAITDDPCACGWAETILHIMPDGAITRGCPSCEAETPEQWIDPDCRSSKHPACPGWTFDDVNDRSTPCECVCHDPHPPKELRP